tara:strand:- start:83 stop:502 length:420 start_codon:yes stop_codon:yes gene_type:complete
MSKELEDKIKQINNNKYIKKESMDYIDTYIDFVRLFNSYEFVVAKFTATWCGPCQRIQPKFFELSKDPEFKHVKCICCDIDTVSEDEEFSEIVENVSVLPTFILFQKKNKLYKMMSIVEGGDLNALRNEMTVYMTDKLN